MPVGKLTIQNREAVSRSKISPKGGQFSIDVLDKIRLGGVSNYKPLNLFTDENIPVNSEVVSRVIDMKSNGDYKLCLYARLAEPNNAGKANQSCFIQSSIDGTTFLDKNIPINIFVDSSNTVVINDEYDLTNRFIRIKWKNDDGLNTRTLTMDVELNIKGLTDLR